MSPRTAGGLLLVVACAAVIELALSFFAYRSTIEREDWGKLEAELAPQVPLFVGTPWLDHSARQHIGATADWSALAPADLRGIPRFQVLSFAGDDGWSRRLSADLAGLPHPITTGTRRFGNLALWTYKQPDQRPALDSLLARGSELKVSAADGGAQTNCRRRREQWQCQLGRTKLGNVEIRGVEVDYRARRCLAVDVRDGTRVTIEVEDMKLGDVLRGHVGFGDFNRRLRSDSPVSLSIDIDGERRMRRVFSDAQGWAPFAVPTDPGTYRVEFVLQASVRGTWEDRGYAERRRHLPCLEARSFEEEAR